jgi:hypothetical protein
MKRASASLPIILGVVPDEIREWKPDIAPQAMVMKRKGNRLPDHTGPDPSVNCVKAGILSSGEMKSTPIASPRMVPILRKVDR